MSKDLNDAKLTAYVLGELSDKEMKEIELLIKNDPKLKADVESIKSFTQLMRSELKVEPVPVLKDNVKQNINSEINKKLFLAKLFSWNSPLKIALSTGFVFVVCFITLDKFDDLQSTAPTNEVVELTNVEEASIDKEVVETPEAKVTFNNPKQKVRKKFTITSSNRKALKKSYSASRRSFKEGVSGGSKGVKASYKKGANLKSIRVDPSKTGLLSTFGSKGVQKKLSKSRSRKSFIVRDKKPEPIEPIIVEFKKPLAEPLSTFSIDVDTASYSHARKQIMSHSKLPSPNDVRIEEFVNYFKYNDKTPSGDEPFSVGLELSESPWNEGYELVRIALKGKATKTKLRKKNLVFVVDTSGSMNNIDKIPLLKDGLNGLVDQLNSHDTISIIKYAGSHGIHLQPTNGLKKDEIKQAINSLMASGSTNGEGGIKAAYKLAKNNFIKGGVNRVILATDGDFNVGISSTDELKRLIKEKAKSGVYLTVLGFGQGRHNDSMMEELSNHGNGNYYYIDSEREGKKVLVDGFNGTIETIAKDVKLQVEFNPNVVQSYRLIGYQNRRLQAEDFNNDKKDAGDIGSGHSVVAFYEVIPQGLKQIDNLKYQKTLKVESNNLSSEMLTVKLRYKKPDASKSKLIEKVISAKSKKKFKSSSDNFKWSVAVASFADILRGGQLSEGFTYDKVLEIAAPLENKIEADKTYRREFIDIIKKAKRVSSYSSSSNESTYQKKSIRKTSNAKIETGGQEEYYAGPNIDKEPIRRVIRKNKRAIKACYELGLHNRNPKMQGKLVLGWTIAEWGKAISPKVISNSLNDKEVANCIKRKLVTWRFPVLPENAKHIVNYPFIFTN